MKTPGWARLERAKNRGKMGSVRTGLETVRLGEMYMENVPEYLQTLAGAANLINNMGLCNESERDLKTALWIIAEAQKDLEKAAAQARTMLEKM